MTSPAWLEQLLTPGQRQRLPFTLQWQKAIAASTLTPAQRTVALIMATHCDRHGRGARVSLDTLASETGLSRRHVARLVPQLRDAGWLRRVGRRGRGGTVVHDLALPAANPRSSATDGTSSAVRSSAIDGRSSATSDTEVVPLVALEDVGGLEDAHARAPAGPRSARDVRLQLVAAGILRDTPSSAKQPPLLAAMTPPSPGDTPPGDQTPPDAP